MNDLAVAGARGHSMIVTFVLEEGLPSAILEAEVRAMSSALRRAGAETRIGYFKPQHLYSERRRL